MRSQKVIISMLRAIFMFAVIDHQLSRLQIIITISFPQEPLIHVMYIMCGYSRGEGRTMPQNRCAFTVAYYQR